MGINTNLHYDAEKQITLTLTFDSINEAETAMQNLLEGIRETNLLKLEIGFEQTGTRKHTDTYGRSVIYPW